jgi:alpha-glucosidase (family GH31 glycosyl hydrolase)
MTYFWKTDTASHIDFFDPEALAWWQNLMNGVLDLGVDGWKVDMSDYHVRDLGDKISTYAGIKTLQEYTDRYYRAFYEHTVRRRGPDRAMITARPYCSQTDPAYWYAPIDANTAGWVGDQRHDWLGLQAALRDIFISAAAGYAAVGSDIGGYRGQQYIGDDYKTVLLRWAQMGALMPIMENGGLDEHRPWMYDQETTDIYRYFAKLHHQLVPYLYSYDIDAHHSGISIVRPIGEGNEFDIDAWQNDWRYLLGEDIFVAALHENVPSREIAFPDGLWIDYWDEDSQYEAGEVITYNVPLAQYPVFLRAGAIIPMQVDDSETGHGSYASKDRLTFLFYPFGQTNFVFHKNPDEDINIACTEAPERIQIDISPSSEAYVLRVKSHRKVEQIRSDSDVILAKLPTFEAFEDSVVGWYDDPEHRYVWIKFSTRGNSIGLTLEPADDNSSSVELISFQARVEDNQVLLTWRTAIASDFSGFELQRKNRNGQFAAIGSYRFSDIITPK